MACFWDLKQHVLPNTTFWSLVFSLVHMASLLVGCQPTLCAVRLREVWHSLWWGASGVACREGWANCSSNENLASMLNKLRDGREEVGMLSFGFQRMGKCKAENITRIILSWFEASRLFPIWDYWALWNHSVKLSARQLNIHAQWMLLPYNVIWGCTDYFRCCEKDILTVECRTVCNWNLLISKKHADH